MRIVTIETPADRAQYDDLMEQAYRLRYRVFVDEKGWRYKQRDDGRDEDAIDGPDCTYLLAVQDGQVFGHARLVPAEATNAHIRTEEKLRILRALPGIMGFSLVCVEPALRGGPKARSIVGHLFLTACDFALASGIPQFYVETDASFIILLRVLGFRVTSYDRGMDVFGSRLVFASFDITPEAVASARSKINLFADREEVQISRPGQNLLRGRFGG